MRSRDKFFIGGAWVSPARADMIAVENPATEQVICTVPAGDANDADRAVAAARAAQPSWGRLAAETRAGFLTALHDAMSARHEELAEVVAQEVGSPLAMARRVQIGLPIQVLASYPKILKAFDFEEGIDNSLVVREPVGVVAAITPWNYPLHQAMAKVAPALAAGCTVVLKPSGLAPLTAYILAEFCEEAGLPAGVLNVVTGTGLELGEALVRHPGIDMVSFTGSVESGRRIAQLAAESVKRVCLELGGKSANVILPDADMDIAVKVGVGNCFLNAGQTCSAWTRMLVPSYRHDELSAMAARYAAGYTVGDPLQAGTRLGPLVSSAQRDRVRRYIQSGIDEGATLVAGGTEPPAGLSTGYFVSPTVFGGVRRDMTIAREEIFGPVLAILPYRDTREALDIANDSVYGLAGGVWSADTDAAIEFARGMRTGQVDINGGRFNPIAPFGGYKQSGYGRELGRLGLEEFCQVKSLQR
jgi:aldehyde dehydrogenase (NAD+)